MELEGTCGSHFINKSNTSLEGVYMKLRPFVGKHVDYLSNEFAISTGFHQESTLNLYHFALVMDKLIIFRHVDHPR